MHITWKHVWITANRYAYKIKADVVVDVEADVHVIVHVTVPATYYMMVKDSIISCYWNTPQQVQPNKNHVYCTSACRYSAYMHMANNKSCASICVWLRVITHVHVLLHGVSNTCLSNRIVVIVSIFSDDHSIGRYDSMSKGGIMGSASPERPRMLPHHCTTLPPGEATNNPAPPKPPVGTKHSDPCPMNRVVVRGGS